MFQKTSDKNRAKVRINITLKVNFVGGQKHDSKLMTMFCAC